MLRRTVPLQVCKLIRRQRTETRMRSRMIIIKPPGFDDLPRFGQTAEPVFVQALVAQAAVEAYMDPARDFDTVKRPLSIL